MYFPYFRGKQYELVTVRESAGLFAAHDFVPIIEPVKEALQGLTRVVDALVEAGANAVIVVNPQCGDLAPRHSLMEDFFARQLGAIDDISAGLILTETTTVNDAIEICSKHAERTITLIHSGFTQPKALADRLRQIGCKTQHVFLEATSGKLYQRHFQGSTRVLIRDGFQRRINREHPRVEFFSDLHITYPDEGMDGFGDFLIVGDDFSESGGPAYAVAIHLTFIDAEQDGQMFIYHFVSDRQDTPTDPAGKFAEALSKLVREVERRQTNIKMTQAVQEFLDLHRRGHFPGLGYVKKLSMEHHVQTLADFLK
jgi:hypothetical protein